MNPALNEESTQLRSTLVLFMLQLYRLITRDLLISRSWFLRRSIVLNLSFRSAQKRAPTDKYRRRRRRNIDAYRRHRICTSIYNRPENQSYLEQYNIGRTAIQLAPIERSDAAFDRCQFYHCATDIAQYMVDSSWI